MKKCLTIIFATLLTVSALTGCASPKSLAQRNSSSQTASPNASAAYEKLIAFKTEGYGQQSVADFNAALASSPDELTEFLAAQAEVISTISHDDENYDFFTTTMSFSSDELYCEHMEEGFSNSFGRIFGRKIKKENKTEEVWTWMIRHVHTPIKRI